MWLEWQLGIGWVVMLEGVPETHVWGGIQG